MNDTDKDVKTSLGFLEIASSLANLAQRLDIANKRGQPIDVTAEFEKAMDIIKYPKDDPINDDVIEVDTDTQKSSAFREAFRDDTEPRGWAEHYFEVGYEAGLRAERVRIADSIKAALAGEFIDQTPSAFRSRFHTIENELRQTDSADSGE